MRRGGWGGRCVGLALAAMVAGGCERCDGDREPAAPGGSEEEGASTGGSSPEDDVVDDERGSSADDDAATLPDALEARPAFGDLTFDRPLALASVPGEDGAFVVLEQDGVAWLVRERDGRWQRARLLDLSAVVRREHNEEGMLSLALHPDFPRTRELFVYYSRSGPRRTVLSRFPVPEPLEGSIDPGHEEILLEVEQPYGNHNGGTILFGPDGHLYLGLGDGGAGGDPHGHGQDLSTLLGSIIRIDVDRSEPGRAYAVPEDNPFVGRNGARPEIFAYGLRNPWRMSFDRETGALWAADVGQNTWEEINRIERGGNYGWNLREGKHEFRSGEPATPLIDPVFEYGHDEGQSITGGYVYRGRGIPALRGAYVYADFVSGRIWALRYDEGEVRAHRELADTDLLLSSFGEGSDGELYVTSFDGRIYRLVAD